MSAPIITAAEKLACITHACPHCRGTGQWTHPDAGGRLRARFDSHWLPDLRGDCWVWVSYANQAGYGMMNLGSRVNGTKRPGLAHRISYELHVGPIPRGLVIDHLCRNRYCVNPAHLEPVTPDENTRRGNAGRNLVAIQSVKTHCPQGHALSGTNLYQRGDGSRGCRACRNAASKAYVQRKRVAIAADYEKAAAGERLL